MSWQELTIAPCGTHHLRQDHPAYDERFDEILKFHTPGLAPVRLAGEAWHIHPDGHCAYVRRFRQTFGFYEGVAAVADDEGWHHITPDGEAVYSQRYAWCGNFQEGRCAVRLPNGRYLHITPKGVPAYGATWRYVGDFRDGIGVVQADDGRSTHIDLNGQPIHNGLFLDLDVFHKRYARARDEAGWMHIDCGGIPTYARRFASVEPFYNGQARVERFDGGLEVIDEKGTPRVELRSAQRSDFASLSADMVGFWRTQTIAAAVDLGVIEALPGTVDEVAERCQSHPDKTLRLLRGLGELSIVVQDASQWQATPRGEYLRADHPLTLAGAAGEYARHFSPMWESLPESLRRAGRWEPPDIFKEVAQDKDRQASHHRMLLSYARHDYPGVPLALGLRGDERLVDAGGGLGFLSSALLDTYPELHVMMLDRPEVVDQARRLQPFQRRLGWCTGDLFAPWPVDADTVVLARVLHDWDDLDATRILRRAREVLSAGNRIFVIEMLLSERGGVSGSLCDLHLMMVTGGRERTAAEYSALMTEAGFELTEVRRIPALPTVLVGVAR